MNPFAERTTWLYDALGRVTTMTHANLSVAEHDYDAAGRLTALRNLKADRSVLSIFTYSYDPIGNRTGVEEANGDLVTWSYDETYQLTREQRDGANAYDTTFTYDGVGNRLTKIEAGVTTTYAYDEANQLLTAEDASGLTTFTYDANGNTTGEIRPNGDRVTYTWDIENMLTQAALPTGATSTFVYDGDRRLRSKSEADGVVNFVRDLERVLVEADANWATVARYTVQGGGWFDPLVAMRQGNASSFYHLDALGSASKLTDANAVTLAEYLYQAFGADTVLSGTITNPYCFIAAFGYYKTGASLLHLGARYLSVPTGRFVSRDQLESRTSRYRYAKNRPYKYVDPSGLRECRCCGPDITKVLASTLGKIVLKWLTLGEWQRLKACWYIHVPPWAWNAWDIEELFAEWPTTLNCPAPTGTNSPCYGTVGVDGKCFLAQTVNYVMYGLITSLCGYSESYMLTAISLYRGWRWWDRAFYEAARAWGLAGYRGYPQHPSPSESKPECPRCPDPAWSYQSDFRVHWSGVGDF